MGFVARLYTYDRWNFQVLFSIYPDREQLWWRLRGWCFAFAIVLSAISVIVSTVALVRVKRLLWWTIIDLLCMGLWFAAFALLYTSPWGNPLVIASGDAQAIEGGYCITCVAFQGLWAASSLAACSWLLSFLVTARYYRKGKQAV